MFKTFEEAIYQRLLNYKDITESLALYNEQPAVFHNNFPNDKAQGWGFNPQYPRIVFYVDWADEPERIISGRLIVYIQWLNSQFIQAEVIDALVKQSLSNVFFNTERGAFCCSWNTSEALTFEGTESIVNGIRMDFNVLAFPDQRTYLDPDPITGLENYLKTLCPEVKIINRDPIPDIFVPDDPVIYVRSIGFSNRGEDTYAYRFMELTSAIHVISTDPGKTRKTIGKAYQQIMIDGDFDLENGNQFLVTDAGNNMIVEYGNSSLLNGQFNLTGRFALNAVEPNDQIIKEINVRSAFKNANESSRKETEREYPESDLQFR